MKKLIEKWLRSSISILLVVTLVISGISGIRNVQASDESISEDRENLWNIADTLEDTSSKIGTKGAENILPTLFNDGMIFQQEKPMNLWGYSENGNRVVAKLYQGEECIETQTTTVAESGRWDIAFAKRAGSCDTTYTIEIWIEDNLLKKIENVLVGELWVAAGQSNMEWLVAEDMDSKEILAEADNAYLRFFKEPLYPYGSTGEQLLDSAKDIPGAYWGYGNVSENVATMSSIGYTFAKKLQESLKVPVGIVYTPIGGTDVEGWLSRDAIENNASVKQALVERNLYYTEENWPETAGSMATLYNQKIGPLEGMNVAGVIWYQGENNCGRSDIYDIELDLLKRSWSKVFGFPDEDMPFIFTQLAPYSYEWNSQALGYMAQSMENAWKMSEDKNTAMITIYDLPLEHIKNGVTSNPVHPRSKIPVAERFYNSAMNMVYGGTEEYTAPVYKSMEIKDNAIYVTLNRVGSGLKISGSSKDLHGFTIAGKDSVYIDAKAELVDEDTVKVWNDFISEPANVMYAFNNFNQAANLCNSAGIPTSPFSTQKLPGMWSGDSSISFFTAQDWMYADEDVWVYKNAAEVADTHGYMPSFQVKGGSYTYSADVLAEGEASLCVSYDGDFSVSPILSYEGIKQDWSKFDILSVALLNPNHDVTVDMTITSGGNVYTVPTIDGKDNIEISGEEEAFTVVSYDLTALKLEGKIVSDTDSILQALSDVTFNVSAQEAGTMYFDAFSYGKYSTAPFMTIDSANVSLGYMDASNFHIIIDSAPTGTYRSIEMLVDGEEYEVTPYVYAGTDDHTYMKLINESINWSEVTDVEIEDGTSTAPYDDLKQILTFNGTFYCTKDNSGNWIVAQRLEDFYQDLDVSAYVQDASNAKSILVNGKVVSTVSLDTVGEHEVIIYANAGNTVQTIVGYFLGDVHVDGERDCRDLVALKKRKNGEAANSKVAMKASELEMEELRHMLVTGVDETVDEEDRTNLLTLRDTIAVTDFTPTIDSAYGYGSFMITSEIKEKLQSDSVIEIKYECEVGENESYLGNKTMWFDWSIGYYGTGGVAADEVRWNNSGTIVQVTYETLSKYLSEGWDSVGTNLHYFAGGPCTVKSIIIGSCEDEEEGIPQDRTNLLTLTDAIAVTDFTTAINSAYGHGSIIITSEIKGKLQSGSVIEIEYKCEVGENELYLGNKTMWFDNLTGFCGTGGVAADEVRWNDSGTIVQVTYETLSKYLSEGWNSEGAYFNYYSGGPCTICSIKIGQKVE